MKFKGAADEEDDKLTRMRRQMGADIAALATRIEGAESIQLVELPESGTRRTRTQLGTRDEVFIVEALRLFARETA